MSFGVDLSEEHDFVDHVLCLYPMIRICLNHGFLCDITKTLSLANSRETLVKLILIH